MAQSSGQQQTILLLGGGGREHALAWALRRSPGAGLLLVAPGNGGTRAIGGTEHLPHLAIADPRAVAKEAGRRQVDLVVVGPEAPLAAGVADALAEQGIPCFGPSQAAARIESSKVFAKAFMDRHQIPTAGWRAFADADAARDYLRHLDANARVVLKAGGLAGGKGVLLPEDRDEALEAVAILRNEGLFGEAGQEIVVEERLEGPEVSLLAFCDGQTARPMPPARDHKRLLDGDRGPNTGGMGAFAPVPGVDATKVARWTREILQPVLQGLAAEGSPYVGVLYAGLMLTPQGPKVLEFNCRFGDPEAQVLLPLLDDDLLEILHACTTGTLARRPIRWRRGAAACVVAASAGYPGAYASGEAIEGLEAARRFEGVEVFEAGTAHDEVSGRTVTTGGRVLAVAGLGEDLDEALQRTYRGMGIIRFQGMQHRRDIGRSGQPQRRSAYAQAGVDIDAGAEAVRRMKREVEATHGPQVLSGVGTFGGLYDAAALRQMEAPVLVSSTDGVGTKTMVAAAVGRFDTIGQDLVNHCIDDILVQGARPLFFLDYVATSRLDPAQIAATVSGCARACREAGCALLGGETAEMPGVYRDGEFDLAGTIVGVVERGRLISGEAIAEGDAIVGWGSSGLHTNGYSLARALVGNANLQTPRAELDGQSLADALLAPHRSYLPAFDAVVAAGVEVRGMAHITGGGLVDNPPRVLPEGLAARLERGSWEVPPIFDWLRRRGQVDDEEMARVFNLGLGMLVFVPAEQAERAVESTRGAGIEAWPVGRVVARGDGEAVVWG